jgi:hypothetical protein
MIITPSERAGKTGWDAIEELRPIAATYDGKG